MEDSQQMRRQIGLLLRASLIKRYHNRTILGGDNVGRHSFMVAWFCWFLSGGYPRTPLLMAALQHDVNEACLGDIPAPVTRAMGKGKLLEMEAQVLLRFGMPNYEHLLTDTESKILKAADRLDGMLYSLYEVQGLGNKWLTQVLQRYVRYVRIAADELPDVHRQRVMELSRACFEVLRCINVEDEEHVGIES